MSDIAFPVKTIRWSQYEQVTPILLQEENGPCPLIALVNTLLLRSDIEARTFLDELPIEPTEGGLTVRKIDTDKLRSLLKKRVGDRVSLSEILTCLGDLLLELKNVDSSVVNNLLENLPLLHTGLDVNPNLVTGGFPPDDLASQISNVFDLKFVHGWCWEPCLETPANRVFEELQTFDSVLDYLLGSASEVDLVAKQDVRAWLEDNRSQLTSYGLQKLDQSMNADLVAIFFRNNHFSTLYKANDHDFYLLLTDTAFLKSGKYVWQSVNSASGGEDIYFSGDFQPVLEGDDYNVDTNEEDDMLYIRRLQEKEDSEYAKRLQKSYNSKSLKNKQPSEGLLQKQSPQATSEPIDKKDKKKKKKTECVIC